MSNLFVLGCAGGLIALATTQVLPAAVSAVKTGAGPKITGWRIAGVVVIVAIFLAAGGVAAVLVGGDTKAALAAGMGWEALLGGALKTGKALSG